MPTTMTTDRRYPLIVTADPVLLDDLLRLAAAGSAEVRVANDAVAARAGWAAAPFVLLGVDAVEEVVRARMPVRGAVMLVARADQQVPPWRFAEAGTVVERHAPLFGEHNREILGGVLGLSDDELVELADAAVIGDAPLNPRVG